MANVALILWNLGEELEKARSLSVQGLNTRHDVLGLGHAHTLTSMTNLTVTYTDFGQWDEAGKLNRTYGPAWTIEHPYTGSAAGAESMRRLS